MSNGNINPPQLTGWQYVILQVAILAASLISASIAGCATHEASKARSQSEANLLRVKEVEKRVYDVQAYQRKVVIGAEPPPPIKEE